MASTAEASHVESATNTDGAPGGGAEENAGARPAPTLMQQLIMQAIEELKEPVKGSSIATIKKYIEQNNRIELVMAELRKAIASGVEAGLFTQTGQRLKNAPHA